MLFQMRFFMSRLWVLLHLLILSAEDVKERQLPMAVIWELGVTGIGYAVLTGRLPALLPGLSLLAFSYFCKEQIGYGDSWLILALGMWMKLGELLHMFGLGLLLGVICAISFRKKELPLVPFLTAAYVIGEWI